MKTNYTMKEATNKEEAIISILDVMNENPVWLNKCTDYLSIMLRRLNKTNREFVLDISTKEEIIDLFVKLKTEYYNFKDNTVWSQIIKNYKLLIGY